MHDIAIRHWQTWLRWLGPSYGPAIVSILLLTASGTTSYHPDHAWLLLLIGTINGGMFAAAVLSWKFALLKADTLDDLLEPCHNRDHLVAVIAAAIRHRWQAPPPMVAAAAALTRMVSAGLHLSPDTVDQRLLPVGGATDPHPPAAFVTRAEAALERSGTHHRNPHAFRGLCLPNSRRVRDHSSEIAGSPATQNVPATHVSTPVGVGLAGRRRNAVHGICNCPPPSNGHLEHPGGGTRAALRHRARRPVRRGRCRIRRRVLVTVKSDLEWSRRVVSGTRRRQSAEDLALLRPW
ncbi:hypothetical protein ACFQ9X_09385 [Catenulispora yoronensis]